MASPNVSEASVVSRACPGGGKCPVIMEFENGSFRSLGGSRPVRLAGYINQDETAILCGVWEFVGQEPNNSVYLAPIGFADVVLSSILLLISYHTPILLLESWRTLHSSGHLLIRSTYRKTSNSDKVDSTS